MDTHILQADNEPSGCKNGSRQSDGSSEVVSGIVSHIQTLLGSHGDVGQEVLR